MRFPDLIRFGSNQPPETGVSTDPVMQIAGNDNMAEKLTSLQAAVGESLTPKLEAAPEGANPTEAEKIAAAVDLAISLEDS